MLAAPCQGFNTANVEEYTTALLKWWKRSHPTIPTWAKAARIIFAMAPSSAGRSASSHSSSACSSRTSSALQLQGAVMLKYNKRHAAMWAEAVTGGVIMWREQPKRLCQAGERGATSQDKDGSLEM